MQPPNFLSKHFVCHVFPISQWWGTLQTSHLECPPLRIGMYFAGKGMKKLLQKAAKGNERISRKIIQVVMRVIFRNCGFVRFPVFGTISGPHLECVQRILFVLFHSNFLVQALSNGRFWPEQMMPGLFLKEIATKAGIEHPAQKLHVWTVGDRNPTQKGLARKPWIQDQPETFHFSKFA